MITPIDYLNDKSYYPAYGISIATGLLTMIKVLLPLDIFTGITGYLLTIFTTSSTMFVGLIVTGLYQKHKIRILNCVETKVALIIKRKKNGKKNNKTKAA